MKKQAILEPTDREEIKKRFVHAVKWIVETHPSVSSATEVAEAIGTGKPNLSRVINQDGSYPTIEWLAGMIIHYNISGDWLLTGKGVMENAPDISARVKRLEQAVAVLMQRNK